MGVEVEMEVEREVPVGSLVDGLMMKSGLPRQGWQRLQMGVCEVINEREDTAFHDQANDEKA